jgi:hypothetical protein
MDSVKVTLGGTKEPFPAYSAKILPSKRSSSKAANAEGVMVKKNTQMIKKVVSRVLKPLEP